MLDYYGSILISDDEIDRQLIDKFKDYNKDYILKIIQNLRDIKLLPTKNSISGWNIFVKGFIQTDIKDRIQWDTNIAKKKLLIFYSLKDNSHIDYDVLQLICNKIYK